MLHIVCPFFILRLDEDAHISYILLKSYPLIL